MKASALEFRLRMMIQFIIIILGFWAPWTLIGAWNLRRISTLQWLALKLFHTGLMSFGAASSAVIVAGALAAGAGAWLRVWGAASLGYAAVHDGQMQGGGLVAAGPYRHVRNPLYLGGWLVFLALVLLMPLSGALVAPILITVHFLRLILGEEAFLSAKLGEAYREYLARVPRLMPSLRTRLPLSPPPAASKPQWVVAALTEIFPIGLFFTMAVLAWRFDRMLMLQGVIFSFGLSLVMKAIFGGERKGKTAA
jgi:protein-S-isoprenylcysteine O-methyltransferase Ste14